VTSRALTLLAAVALLVPAGCGQQTTRDPAAAGSLGPRESVAGPRLAEATAVRVLRGGSGFAITVRVSAGEPGCAGRARGRYDTFENGTHYVTTLFRTSGADCPGTEHRTVTVPVPGSVDGRDLSLNEGMWKPGPGSSYVRCSSELGCHPPKDRCDDTWVEQMVDGVELPPERQVDTVVCAQGWLVVDVRAVSTGCQSVDGSTPPAGCAGTGVRTRWFARLGSGRRWEVVASGTAAGCADVAGLPRFPRRLCSGLPPLRAP
jgi:hypothetical protein